MRDCFDYMMDDSPMKLRYFRTGGEVISMTRKKKKPQRDVPESQLKQRGDKKSESKEEE